MLLKPAFHAVLLVQGHSRPTQSWEGLNPSPLQLPMCDPFCSLQGKSGSSLAGARGDSWEQQWGFAPAPGEHKVHLVNKVTPKKLHLLQCRETTAAECLLCQAEDCKTWTPGHQWWQNILKLAMVPLKWRVSFWNEGTREALGTRAKMSYETQTQSGLWWKENNLVAVTLSSFCGKIKSRNKHRVASLRDGIFKVHVLFILCVSRYLPQDNDGFLGFLFS